MSRSEFIFDISTNSWNEAVTSTNNNISRLIPVLNLNKSFIDLSFNTAVNGDLTTVTVGWSSYNAGTDTNNDGLHFVITASSENNEGVVPGSAVLFATNKIPYFRNTSVNIRQFGNIPLSRNLTTFVTVTKTNIRTVHTVGIFNSFEGRITASDTPTIQTNTNFSNLFHFSVSSQLNISSWNVSDVVNMSNAFSFTSNFTADITSWNTSNVTNMNQMFLECQGFNQPIGTSPSWDVTKVTNMTAMFAACGSFNQDISWNTANVTNMSFMFSVCRAFNPSIFNLNTSSLTNAGGMFQLDASFNPQNTNMNSWNMTRVTSMSYMFVGCRSFNVDIGNWRFSTETDITMEAMFAAVVGSTNAFNQDISSWNVARVTNMSLMFARCNEFNQPIGTSQTWNVFNVRNMSNMFILCSNFNQPINWNTAQVTLMNSMFSGCSTFNPQTFNLNVANVINTDFMFNGCLVFNPPTTDPPSTNISNWDVSKVTTMFAMFRCARKFNHNLSRWNTSKVREMFGIFDMRDQSTSPNLSLVGSMSSFAYLAGGPAGATGVWNWQSIQDTSGNSPSTVLSNVREMIRNIVANDETGRAEYSRFLNNMVNNPRVIRSKNSGGRLALSSNANDALNIGLNHNESASTAFTTLTSSVPSGFSAWILEPPTTTPTTTPSTLGKLTFLESSNEEMIDTIPDTENRFYTYNDTYDIPCENSETNIIKKDCFFFRSLIEERKEIRR